VLEFRKLNIPTTQIAQAMQTWGNDLAIKHLMQPHTDKAALNAKVSVTVRDLNERLENGHVIYLIYANEQLIGEMNYVVDPPHLLKHEKGSAWIGISIGVADARGRGIGRLAMQHLEDEIRTADCVRIELGVFEYNAPAIKLYTKMGYEEIGRIPEFTYWDGKMWTDIRMDKRLK
jgi:RimJ/RimL family protein N-acetyltransferase